jgi:hypothetical protein
MLLPALLNGWAGVLTPGLNQPGPRLGYRARGRRADPGGNGRGRRVTAAPPAAIWPGVPINPLSR